RASADAVATAEAAMAADASGPWPLLALSRARSLQGKGDEALALAQQAKAASAGTPALVAVGFAQEARGDLVAAEAAYRAALAAPDAPPCATVGLARVL